MTIADEPNADPDPEAASDARVDDEATSIPGRPNLWWPVVQALREIGRAASDSEITEHVAEAMGFTHQQRTAMNPAGHETKLRNRVRWAIHDLKEVGAIHDPEPAYRALTALGQEVDEERIKALRKKVEAERRRSRADEKHEIDDERDEQDRANVVYVAGLIEQYESDPENATDKANQQAALCHEWQEKLAPDRILDLSREDLSAVIVTKHTGDMYLSPAPSPMQDFMELNEEGFTSVVANLKYLCWGQDNETSDIAERYTKFIDSSSPYWVRNISGHGAIKLLSICHPQTILPIGSHYKSGNTDYSVGGFLLRLGLGAPQGSTPGDQIIDAHKRLRDVLTDHFEDDSLKMGFFLQWLAQQDPLPMEDPLQSVVRPLTGGLDILVQQFLRDSGFPTEMHKEQRRLREQWSQKLAPEKIASLSRKDLAAYTSYAVDSGEYVHPATDVPRWIRDLDHAHYGKLLDSIRDLCRGNEDLPKRIDRLVHWRGSRKDTGTKGFAQGNISATLAICRPDSFIPVWYQEGPEGRKQMLHRLGLPEPRGTTFGEQIVDANDRLRKHLSSYLRDDSQAIACFLYWLIEQETDLDGRDKPNLAGLAYELLIDVDFLEDIVELLQDKGQVILYGPPGTGKTYLARELAKELAPEESCRALVQYHPSTTYEDFFEGYRPAGTGDDGGIRYKLTPGPLKRMARRARKAPDDKKHVMIIDEINRGNLPSVLGELLFLLEYRDESVETLYRPKKPFSLPNNLWFIGTMNTADRSIALVDAALRRRFHFVPFFPDRGPMAGLLGRWLDREGEPAWVGQLVDAVNDELKEILEGSHLLLGPSHFMKKYGSSLGTQRERLRRIWEYNIEPFIEDQFFGDPQQIDRFRFDAVMRRNGPTAGSDVDAGDGGGDPEGTNDPEGEHAAAEGDTAPEVGSVQPEGER